MFAVQLSTIKMIDFSLVLATLEMMILLCFQLIGSHEAKQFYQKLLMNFNFQLAIIRVHFCHQPRAV